VTEQVDIYLLDWLIVVILAINRGTLDVVILILLLPYLSHRVWALQGTRANISAVEERVLGHML